MGKRLIGHSLINQIDLDREEEFSIPLGPGNASFSRFAKFFPLLHAA